MTKGGTDQVPPFVISRQENELLRAAGHAGRLFILGEKFHLVESVPDDLEGKGEKPGAVDEDDLGRLFAVAPALAAEGIAGEDWIFPGQGAGPS